MWRVFFALAGVGASCRWERVRPSASPACPLFPCSRQGRNDTLFISASTDYITSKHMASNISTCSISSSCIAFHTSARHEPIDLLHARSFPMACLDRLTLARVARGQGSRNFAKQIHERETGASKACNRSRTKISSPGISFRELSLSTLTLNVLSPCAVCLTRQSS